MTSVGYPSNKESEALLPVDYEFPVSNGELIFLAETSGGVTGSAVQWGKLSLFCFTRERRQKNKQFHGRLGTVIHGVAQSRPVSSSHCMGFCNNSGL